MSGVTHYHNGSGIFFNGVDIQFLHLKFGSIIALFHLTNSFRSLVNPDKLHMPMSSASEMNEKIRDLLTKQVYEVAKLESDLHAQECSELSNTINQYDRKKQDIANQLSVDLQKQLAKAKTPYDCEKLLGTY